MAQFDVFVNPILAARRAYPFVVAMQSDIATDASYQIVAPLAPRASLPKVAGHLTPTVDVNGADHVVIVPRMTPIRYSDLDHCIASISTARASLLAAIDYLFFGV
jgi:toxin CcdB